MPRISGYAMPLALTGVCMLSAVFEPSASVWFAYRLEAIRAGELWRWLTGNVVHLGWIHLVLNLAALWVISVIFPPLHTGTLRFVALVLAALSVGLGLTLFSEEIAWYVGLSGVLHGLFAAGVLAELRNRRIDTLILGMGLLVKLGYEQWIGAMPGSERITGGMVVVDAHLYGAVGGVLAYALHRIFRLAHPA
jgi:rhomboid family GlyGly-CTERM serine protease